MAMVSPSSASFSKESINSMVVVASKPEVGCCSERSKAGEVGEEKVYVSAYGQLV